MEHHMQNWSAPDLADLNRGGVNLMKTRIAKLLNEVRARRGSSNQKIRILDIGCGNSPYLKRVDLSDVELVLCDRVDLSASNKINRPYKPFKHKNAIFNEIHFPEDIVNKPIGKFDIIILSAVLHELYQQWNLKNLSEKSDVNSTSSFSTWFFQQFLDLKLVNGTEEGFDSFIVVGEIYHRNIWSHDALERARRVQYRLIKHADPPTAFPDPISLVFGAREVGYTLERFDESFSVPEDHKIFNEIDVIDDEDVKLIFRNRRFAAQLFSCSHKIYERKSDSIDKIRTHQVTLKSLISESVHSAKNLSENFVDLNKLLKTWSLSSNNDELENEYNKIFVEHKENGKKTLGIFSNLSKECALLTRNYFQFVKMSPPQNLAFWFSVNSCILSNRYLPKIDGQYRCIHTNPAEMLEVNKDQVEASVDTWSAIAFNSLLGDFDKIFPDTALFTGIKPPSLFNWLNHKTNTKPPKSISITYSRPDFEHQNPPCNPCNSKIKSDLGSTKYKGVLSSSMEDAISVSNLELWKDHKAETDFGDQHVMTLIPNIEFNEKSAGRFINELTNFGYCEAHNNDKRIVAIKESIASIYLDFIFLKRCFDGHVDANASSEIKLEMAFSALNGFRSRWDRKIESNKIAIFSNEKELDEELAKKPLAIFPKDFMARITRVCDLAEVSFKKGDILPRTWITLSPTSLVPEMHDSNIPGNVMFFTDRMFGSVLLDLIMVEVDKAFQAVHTIELEWKTKKYTAEETRSDTFSLMLTSFGHDGKRPAMTIEKALKDKNIPDKSVRSLALYSAHSLVNRLASYSRIPIETQDNSYIIKQLESEAISHISLVKVERLWQIEALNQIIRIIVDESEWRVIRDEGLFPNGFEWDDAENLIGTLINSSNDVYEDSRSVDIAIATCLQKLSSNNPPIIIKYEGPSILCPKQLAGRDSSKTIPKLRTILSFVFSELMTNMARHGWAGYSSGIKNEGLFYALRVRTESDGYYFDVCFAPSHENYSPNPILEGENRTITGIMSIKLALQSIATKAQEQLITWACGEHSQNNKKNFGMQPFPRQSKEEICGHFSLWTITTIGPIATLSFKEST
jgi:hypothetical protein